MSRVQTMTDDTTNEPEINTAELEMAADFLDDVADDLLRDGLVAHAEQRRNNGLHVRLAMATIVELRRELDHALRQWARLECQTERLRTQLYAAKMREHGVPADDVQRYLDARDHGPYAARRAPMMELVAEDCRVAAGGEALRSEPWDRLRRAREAFKTGVATSDFTDLRELLGVDS